jgi:hypothetical protein
MVKMLISLLLTPRARISNINKGLKLDVYQNISLFKALKGSNQKGRREYSDQYC